MQWEQGKMKKYLFEVQKFILDTSITFSLKTNVALFLLLFGFQKIIAQEISDSSTIELESIDSVDMITIKGDTSYLSISERMANFISPFISIVEKKSIYDVQILRQPKSNNWIFVWIFIAVFSLALFKNLFKSESEEFFSRLLSISNSSNLGRLKSAPISMFSFLLVLIFAVNFSLIASIAIHYFYPAIRYDTLTLTIILVFLFTLFIAIKVLVANIIGFIFDEVDAAKFYVQEFHIAIQTIGISIFPLILISTLVTHDNFIFLFYALLLVLFFFFLYFALRGLSTSMNLMYKSLYHFLLYICVEEILVVFLFLKLLTKIAF
jgi:hypothetical protein